MSVKVPVTTLSPSMVSVTSLLASTMSPLQPAKLEPVSATAVSVTTVPYKNDVPLGWLLSVPEPLLVSFRSSV